MVEVEGAIRNSWRRPIIRRLPLVRSHQEVSNYRTFHERAFDFLHPVLEPTQHCATIIPQCRLSEIGFSCNPSMRCFGTAGPMQPGSDDEAVTIANSFGTSLSSHSDEVLQAASQENIVPGSHMVSRAVERGLMLRNIPLLPIRLVLLPKQVVVQPLKRIGEQDVAGERPGTQEIHRFLRAPPLQLGQPVS